MFRTLLWFGLWCISLGTLGVHVKYSDGLEITFNSWWERTRR